MTKEINEISDDTATSYIRKAASDLTHQKSYSKLKNKAASEDGKRRLANRAAGINLATDKIKGTTKVPSTEEKEMDTEEEIIKEQSHQIEAVYTDKHTRKKTKSIMRVNADTKAKAKNKVGVYLSKAGCDVHSLTHMEAVDIVADEIEEGKTYRKDPDNSFASKVRNNMKKKADKAAKDRASEKRAVED